MRYIVILFIFIGQSVLAQTVSVIPRPVSYEAKGGTFSIGPATALVVSDAGDQKAARFFNDYLQQFYGFKLAVKSRGTDNAIQLRTAGKAGTSRDGYSLQVTGKGVLIEGETYPGTFYGIQSLIQLLPVSGKKGSALAVPLVSIRDEPRFSYRGMHLDVGRHMFPVSFVKQYIDYIALHKMNYFHWHLTEDQGWRIEIKKYPELTRAGAYRDGTIIGRYPGTGNDRTRYGGFYTQDEIREVVKYAADRHITVVPEIEMPGHSSAALTAYPHLGCPGTGPYKVEQTWGVFDDVYCAGNDSTFTFLQDVMDEVLALFPSPYIHIGGDESPKANWKKCPRCQARIRAEGLKDEHELQSYFIQRMEKYINSKGRTIIGWDEILEGGLAPNAIVMSWRGEAGGIEAARQQHQVIMTPGSHVYLDHSQSSREDSVTIGGYTTVEKTYSYEPIPKELTPEEGKYILGAQANVWTEYMRYPAKVEYQIFPRMSALSEVLWSPKESRDWKDFEKRLSDQFSRYELWGANYSRAYYDITGNVEAAPDQNGVLVTLQGRDPKDELLYRVDGKKEPERYTGPVVIRKDSRLVAMYYKDRKLMDSLSFNIRVNKATGKPITLSPQPSGSYPGNGPFTLVDGIINEKGGRSQESLGFQSDVEAVIDLGNLQQVSSLMIHALQSGGTYVYPPKLVEAFVSTDGSTYLPVGSGVPAGKSGDPKAVAKLAFKPTLARYIRLKLNQVPEVPAGARGEGEKTWMFLDEIQVN
ncbi:MAG TPA: family 20 glycosylhydrolase [Sphingobacteriaceae bacterium]